MRRGTLRRLIGKNPNGLSWNQASGAYDPRARVVGYRTIEGREYKEPEDPRLEKAAVDRIMAAAEKRRRKAGLPPLEELTDGTEQAPEGRVQGPQDSTDSPTELDFGSFLQSQQSEDQQ